MKKKRVKAIVLCSILFIGILINFIVDYKYINCVNVTINTKITEATSDDLHAYYISDEQLEENGYKNYLIEIKVKNGSKHDIVNLNIVPITDDIISLNYDYMLVNCNFTATAIKESYIKQAVIKSDNLSIIYDKSQYNICIAVTHLMENEKCSFNLYMLIKKNNELNSMTDLEKNQYIKNNLSVYIEYIPPQIVK